MIWLKENTIIVAENSSRLGLTINRGTSKVFKTNEAIDIPITVQALEQVEISTFLGRTIELMQMSKLAPVTSEQLSLS
ncbi:hypothetical protein DPMN_009686 [Dreissena polymorpha]|uniref:Uncharacterized protein n=1 Tax=Dreissena polymorpha TaxID=45954 RepID=A0A9D4S0A0_DREPO|nr:hypothetical protein DPMN_009686 [Dreissena polymorpha]